MQFSIDKRTKWDVRREKITCFVGPPLQLWASWTRNPRMSSSSSKVTVTFMSSAAGGCSQMSQASGRSGWLILMALSSANLDLVMSTLLQSRPLSSRPLTFEGEAVRVEKHVETRKRKPNWQHMWDILQEENLRNNYRYNKRIFCRKKKCRENITQRCSMFSEEEPFWTFCKRWSSRISWDSLVYGGFSIHPSVATISLGKDLSMDMAIRAIRSNEWIRKHLHIQRAMETCQSTVCTPIPLSESNLNGRLPV